MKITIRRAAFAALLPLAFAAPAAAQPPSLGVSANVTKNCIVSAAPLAFGGVDVTTGSAVDGTADLTVRCTSGTEWSAMAGPGTGAGATVAVRRMTDAANNTLDYALYTDPGRTTVWGGGEEEAGDPIIGEGTGSDQLATVYGRVLGGQAGRPSGSYADTVQITLSY
jgi:spore coat protein U-like protein